jgi:NAD+ kinase
MKKIAIMAKVHDPRCQGLAGDLVAWLGNRGCEPLVEAHLARHLRYDFGLEPEVLGPMAELMVVLGGDGTLIAAARALGGNNVPIIGVNLGSLGFLTEITVDELYATLESCLRGDFVVTERMMLQVTVARNGLDLESHKVLNDVVINKGALARIVDLETTVDGDVLTTFKADGLIISTPTGSTGYSLSAGGPIIHPTLNCLIINPICPHTLTNRPVVVADDAQVIITVRSLEDEKLYLTLDGQVGLKLRCGDEVRVRKAQRHAKLVRSPNRNYFEILRTKLKWGER